MDTLDRSLRLTNLNLLPILHAVLKHRNLTQAAAELHVTQSAVSNSLKQLREHFGDELLVKDGRKLRLTQKGAALIEPLERALGAVQDVVASARFDPQTTRRRFRIATVDYVMAVTAPQMARILSEEAPRVSVQMITARGRSTGDLRVETIDMIITPWQVIETALYGDPKLRNEFAFEPLAQEPFVCLARDDDEAFRRGLTVEEYLARPHASFHLDLDVHASLEHGYLFQHGMKQFDRIQTSDFTLLPLIASQSDCVVLAPRSVAQIAARGLPLQIAPCPLPIPDLELFMVWSLRRDHDPEFAWLKTLVKRAISESLGGDALSGLQRSAPLASAASM
jgi:LysR family transcriptional regulator, nod-box dependent transcriptional activator